MFMYKKQSEQGISSKGAVQELGVDENELLVLLAFHSAKADDSKYDWMNSTFLEKTS